MVATCAIKNCRSSRRNCEKSSGTSFHHFPKDLKTCLIWVIRSRNPNLKGLTLAKLRDRVICSCHFLDSDKIDEKHLKKFAIPSLNLPSKDPDPTCFVPVNAIPAKEASNEPLKVKSPIAISDKARSEVTSHENDDSNSTSVTDEHSYCKKAINIPAATLINNKIEDIREGSIVLFTNRPVAETNKLPVQNPLKCMAIASTSSTDVLTPINKISKLTSQTLKETSPAISFDKHDMIEFLPVDDTEEELVIFDDDDFKLGDYIGKLDGVQVNMEVESHAPEINMLIFSQLCRVCAEESDDMRDIFRGGDKNQELVSIMKKYLNIDVCDSDSLPVRVCVICADTLELFHALAINCQQAQLKLQSLLQQLKDPYSTPKEEVSLEVSKDESEDLLDSFEDSSISPCLALDENSLPDSFNQPVVTDLPCPTSSQNVTATSSTSKLGKPLRNKTKQAFRTSSQNVTTTHSMSPLQKPKMSRRVYSSFTKKPTTILAPLQLNIQSRPEDVASNSFQNVATALELPPTNLSATELTVGMQQQVHPNLSKERPLLGCIYCSFAVLSRHQLQSHYLMEHNSGLCMFCDDLYNDFSMLHTHIEKEHTYVLKESQRLWKKKDKDNSELLLHKPTECNETVSKSSENSFKCCICSESLSRNIYLNIHFMICHLLLKIQCPICPKIFYCGGSFEAHKKMHADNGDLGDIKCLNKGKQILKRRVRVRVRKQPPKTRMECNFCSRKYASKKSIFEHIILYHLKEWKYTCTLCFEIFSDVNDIKDHLATHHSIHKKYFKRIKKESEYYCLECKKYFMNEYMYEKHKASHASNIHEKFQCPKCPRHYLSQARLDKHAAVHNDNFEFQCHMCPGSYRTEKLLENHLKEHATMDEQCQTCWRFFKNEFSLAGHMRSHREDSFQCVKCSRVLPNKTLLELHLKKHEVTSNKSFKCTLCSNTFANEVNLTIHMNKHDQGELNCKYCSITFPKKWLRKAHEMLHENNLPYKCSLCPKAFPAKCFLRSHITNSHLKTKEYPCSICSRLFSNQTNRKRHETNFHGTDFPFLCQVCGKSFKVKDDYNDHELSHTAGKPFECSVCDKKFTRRTSRTTHERKHHNIARSRRGITKWSKYVLEVPLSTVDLNNV